jgi:hypothetical protein
MPRESRSVANVAEHVRVPDDVGLLEHPSESALPVGDGGLDDKTHWTKPLRGSRQTHHQGLAPHLHGSMI